MAAYREHVSCALVGVGAAFDFVAGVKAQAPAWLQRAGLEWLFRLASEPRRLWRRYARHNPRFALRMALQIARARWRVSRSVAAQQLERVAQRNLARAQRMPGTPRSGPRQRARELDRRTARRARADSPADRAARASARGCGTSAGSSRATRARHRRGGRSAAPGRYSMRPPVGAGDAGAAPSPRRGSGGVPSRDRCESRRPRARRRERGRNCRRTGAPRRRDRIPAGRARSRSGRSARRSAAPGTPATPVRDLRKHREDRSSRSRSRRRRRAPRRALRPSPRGTWHRRRR